MTWIEGIHFFRLAPTSIVLKPGSIADKFIDADFAVTESQIVVIAFYRRGQEGGLIRKALNRIAPELRKQIREKVATAGDFSSLTDVEVHMIRHHVAEIRLVQPILKAK